MRTTAVAILLFAVGVARAAASCGSGCDSGAAKVENGFACFDINECASNNGGCDAHATCTNTVGGFTCTCNEGYTGNGKTCAPINRCATNNGGCDAHATCTNTATGTSCSCNAGYTGDGKTCSFSCDIVAQSYTYHCDPNCGPFCAGSSKSEMAGYVNIKGQTVYTADWCRDSAVAAHSNHVIGVSLVTVDPVACGMVKAVNYNTYTSAADATALSNALKAAPKGTIFAAITADEPQSALANAVAALKSVCNVDVADLQFRGSFAFVCQVGYPNKTVWRKTPTRQAIGAAVKVTVTGSTDDNVAINSN